MKKFNEDHVENIALELHDFMEEEMDNRGLDPSAVIDFEIFRDITPKETTISKGG